MDYIVRGTARNDKVRIEQVWKNMTRGARREHLSIIETLQEGKVAVVTGATSNVGKGYALALAWAGAKVAIVVPPNIV